jgi:hypothetical protein
MPSCLRLKRKGKKNDDEVFKFRPLHHCCNAANLITITLFNVTVNSLSSAWSLELATGGGWAHPQASVKPDVSN